MCVASMPGGTPTPWPPGGGEDAIVAWSGGHKSRRQGSGGGSQTPHARRPSGRRLYVHRVGRPLVRMRGGWRGLVAASAGTPSCSRRRQVDGARQHPAAAGIKPRMAARQRASERQRPHRASMHRPPRAPRWSGSRDG